MRRGDDAAIKQATSHVANEKAKQEDRIEAIRVFGEIRHSPVAPQLMQLLTDTSDEQVRKAAVQALQSFSDPAIGDSCCGRVYRSDSIVDWQGGFYYARILAEF